MINKYLRSMGWKKYNNKWDFNEVLLDLIVLAMGTVIVIIAKLYLS